MDYETDSVEIQIALISLHERKLRASSPYEPLATNKELDISQFSYEPLKNDMWEEIFPVGKRSSAKQLTPKPVFDVSKLTNPKQIQDHQNVILKSKSNEIRKTSLDTGQTNGKMESNISCSSLFIHNSIDNTAGSATSQHNLYEEASCDVWDKIFPVSQHLKTTQLRQKDKININLQREASPVHNIIKPETDESIQTRHSLLYTNKTNNDRGYNSVQLLNLANDITNNDIKPFSTDYVIPYNKPCEPNESKNSFECDRIGVNSHVGLSIGLLSSENIDIDNTFDYDESRLSSPARTNAKEMVKEMKSMAENEYDSISEYEEIHFGLTSTVEKGQCHSSTPAKRPLPIIPRDHKEETLGYKCCDRASSLIAKTVLIVIVLILVLIFIAVIITAVVLNTGSDKDLVIKPTDIQVDEGRLKVQAYLDKSRLLSVILGDGDGWIYGITVLGHHLFVARGGPFIDVYNTNSFTLTNNITIDGTSGIRAVVASSRFNCLYILCEPWLNVIHRYNMSDNIISNWSVGGEVHALFLTITSDVLVTLQDAQQIKEYTPGGSLIREVLLETIGHPCHSGQLSSGEFVVGHAGLEHRVCLVDKAGLTIQCYGGSPGSDARQFNVPVHLAVDSNDIVLVANYLNNIVVLLSSSLTNLGNIAIPGHQLVGPHAVHVDELNHRLYIGEWANKRVTVLTTV